MNQRAILLITLVGLLSVGALSFSFTNTENAFGQATTTSSTSGVSITIGEEGGGGGFGVKNPASITFSGFAFPGGIVTFLRNESTIGTELTRPDGTFTKTVSVSPGFITFGIRAKDQRGLDSATTNITLNVQANQTINIANIFLSPTITADRFNLQRGGTLRIFGSAFPQSTVRIFNNFSPSGSPMGNVLTSTGGLWEYFFPTEALGDGQYSIKVNAEIQNPHLVSPFSENLEFTIAEIQCRGADFNFDTRVNIIDFSILIFYWERNPAIGNITNICTDLNTDEVVNIFDFSIMMHQWTE